MPKEPISTDQAPPPGGPYSQAIRAGGLVFLAGQGPFDADGNQVDADFAEGVRQTFTNLAAVAAAAGGTLDDAVRVAVYLRDMDDFPAMNEVYGEFFSDPLPARTTIQSDLPGFRIEVDAFLWLGG